MSSLLWDKADVRISNDELAQLNWWAERHAKDCFYMQAILDGNAFITYQIRYCKEAKMLRKGIRCICGKTYYTDEGKVYYQ